jgi:putative glutamine amidotransferase
MTRPRIAVTSWRRELPTFVSDRTLLYTLADEYVRCVADAGGVPLLLPHLSERDVHDVLDVVDGVMVAGGGDVDPSSYGAAPAGSKETDPLADASELALLRAARERGTPTLAICRGMQLVNVAYGGTLVQHLGDPATLHPVPDDPEAVLAARHDVTIEPGSRLAEALGAGRRLVNTIHHQAIEHLGEGLRVTATADDGLIEAVEPEDGWDLLAVQWHPEKLERQDAPLFSSLISSAVRDDRVGPRG